MLYVCSRLDVAPVKTSAVLMCPNRGVFRTEDMPTDVCQFFYECKSCSVLLRPKEGDCCGAWLRLTLLLP